MNNGHKSHITKLTYHFYFYFLFVQVLCTTDMYVRISHLANKANIKAIQKKSSANRIKQAMQIEYTSNAYKN